MTKPMHDSDDLRADPIVFHVDDARRLGPMRQTFRRPVLVPMDGTKIQATKHPEVCEHHGVLHFGDHAFTHPLNARHCPYQKGQRLWVRETWFCNLFGYGKYKKDEPAKDQEATWRKETVYRSDGEFHDHFPEDYLDARWNPPQHMPRWASKWGTMVVLSVSMQRLHAMTEVDARKEGFASFTRDCKLPRFAKEWDKSFGRIAPWSDNPWTWVVEYSVAGK